MSETAINSAAEIERDARSIVLPAVVTLLLDRALTEAPNVMIDSEKMVFPHRSGLDDLNFCPAITSTTAIFAGGKNVLNRAAKLGDILTEQQVEVLGNVEWTAITPDHHFKNNFMTSFPAFALGFVYEAVYAGDVAKPATVEEVLKLIDDPELLHLLWQGMFTASGVWNQTALTPPWQIFEDMRHLYDYGHESPFVTLDDGTRSLKPAILTHLHNKLRERNQARERASVRCPLAVKRIAGITDNPLSSAHLTPEQIEQLTADERLASMEGSGSLRIHFDGLKALKDFFVSFTRRYTQESGVPVIVEDRSWPHQSTITYIGPGIPIPEATQPEPSESCPLNSDYVTIVGAEACTCRQDTAA